MGWVKEARAIKQQKYGNYCQICRELNIEPKSYTSFEVRDLEKFKITLKEYGRGKNGDGI